MEESGRLTSNYGVGGAYTGPELVWPGKYDAKRGRRRLPGGGQVAGGGHPAPISRPALVHGAFQDVMPGFVPAGSVDFVYADPPFASDRVHRASDPGSPDGDKPEAYSDRWDVSVYLNFLDDLIGLSHARLVPGGVLAVHVDHRAGPYVRALMQEHFGCVPGWEGRGGKSAGGGVFVNELVWRYGLGNARGGKHFLRKHDTITVFAKGGAEYYFDAPTGPPSGAQSAKYCHVEEDKSGEGQQRRYMMSYGRKYYFKGGKRLDSVLEIPSISPTSSERTGYPTQKPLALLELLIRTFCRPGGLVLDPVAGCGTTAVASANLERRWVAIDRGSTAIDFARKRLVAHSGAGRFDDVDFTAALIVR